MPGSVCAEAEVRVTLSRMCTDSRPSRIAAPWLALALAALLNACSQEPTRPPAASAARPNILLITVDSLRKDRLQTYGFAGASSPELLKFSKGASVFDDAQSNTPQGLPSYASLMTALPTASHGCGTRNGVLAPSHFTLAEALLATGYDTAAVVTCESLGRQRGLNQGFVHFDDELVLPVPLAEDVSTSAEVSTRGLLFLKAKADAAATNQGEPPWFLWLHYQDPRPDHVFQGFAGEEGNIIALRQAATPDDLYEREVRYADMHIGRVLAGVDVLGIGGQTLVVVVGAHGPLWPPLGPDFTSPDLLADSTSLPLLIRAPASEGGRPQPMVRTIDLAPTLLDYAGLALPPASLGKSFRGLIEGQADWNASECFLELSPDARTDQVGVLTGSHRLLLDRKTGGTQLFERSASGEVEVPGADGAVAQELKRQLAALQSQAQEGASQSLGLRMSLSIRGEASPTSAAAQETEQSATALDGQVQINYANGEPWSRGSIQQGVPTGLWETWFPDGMRKSSDMYDNGVLDGPSLAWMRSGKLRLRSECKAGVPNGRWSRWWDGSIRQAEMHFSDGVAQDTWTYWNAEEVAVLELTFREEGRRVGLVKSFLNGNQLANGEFLDGLRVGVWRTWYRGGGLKRYWPYEAGELHGKSFGYDPRGFLLEGWNGEFSQGSLLPQKVK